MAVKSHCSTHHSVVCSLSEVLPWGRWRGWEAGCWGSARASILCFWHRFNCFGSSGKPSLTSTSTHPELLYRCWFYTGLFVLEIEPERQKFMLGCHRCCWIETCGTGWMPLCLPQPRPSCKLLHCDSRWHLGMSSLPRWGCLFSSHFLCDPTVHCKLYTDVPFLRK